MRRLGAIVAGGASIRFKSDKALTDFAGKPLSTHAIAAVAPQGEMLVISGRNWPGYRRIDDLPAAGCGPLGRHAGALVHPLSAGIDAALCVPCDTRGVPADLVVRLSPGPAVAAGQRIIGLSSSSLAVTLIAWPSNGDTRALCARVATTEARKVGCGRLHNVNSLADLA